jgi:MFS superfamily sulfate permease-like transporter
VVLWLLAVWAELTLTAIPSPLVAIGALVLAFVAPPLMSASTGRILSTLPVRMADRIERYRLRFLSCFVAILCTP